MRLTIVTINYGNILPVIKTINSVSNQSVKCFEHIIIASGISLEDTHKLERKFITPYRKFIFNKDKSLYNAMNIGLENASGDCVLFLNGGDEFYSHESIYTIQNNWRQNVCLAFRTLQVYGKDMYVRPGLKNLHNLIKMPGHQGFVAPINKNKLFYNEKKSLNADGLWMQDNIRKYGVVAFPHILSRFNLGGVSNSASIKSSILLFSSNEVRKGTTEILKIFLRSIVGFRYYYKLLAVMKSYDKICES